MKLVECKKKKGDSNAVFAIALVEDPAIMFDFVYLSNNPTKNLILLAEEKQMIYTPVLIPNQRIVRMGADNEPYQIFFSAETIEEAAQDYMTAKKTDEFNSEHTGQKLNGVQVVESWIVDEPSKDKSTLLGFDVPKGTWMQGIKINDPKTLSKVKDGTFKGISIEGYFDEHLTELNANKLNKLEMKETNTLLGDILAKLSNLSSKKVALASAEIEGGGAIYTEGEFTEGATVYLDEEMKNVADKGSYVLANGDVLTVDNGLIVSSAAPEEMAEDNKDIEQLTEIAESQVNATEKLAEENKSLKEELTEVKTALSALTEAVNLNTGKLSKVDSKVSLKSVTEAPVEDKSLTRFQKLAKHAS